MFPHDPHETVIYEIIHEILFQVDSNVCGVVFY